MDRESASDPKLLAHYEGLVRKTSGMYVGLCEEDFDDVCQLLRIKVFQALLAWNPAKARQTRDAYVFMCVRNRVKDLLRDNSARAKKRALLIEDIAPGQDTVAGNGRTARDRFESRYCSVTAEEIFADVEGEAPLIPSTLTGPERKVVAHLYAGYSHIEIGQVLDLRRPEVATLVQSIREKFADWKPEPEPPVSTMETLPAIAA